MVLAEAARADGPPEPHPRPGAKAIRVLLPVWGEEFVGQFLEYSLPTLLAPGNIPALAQGPADPLRLSDARAGRSGNPGASGLSAPVAGMHGRIPADRRSDRLGQPLDDDHPCLCARGARGRPGDARYLLLFSCRRLHHGKRLAGHGMGAHAAGRERGPSGQFPGRRGNRRGVAGRASCRRRHLARAEPARGDALGARLPPSVHRGKHRQLPAVP